MSEVLQLGWSRRRTQVPLALLSAASLRQGFVVSTPPTVGAVFDVLLRGDTVAVGGINVVSGGHTWL